MINTTSPVPAARGEARLALALLLFLFGVYVLTASGHTYSPDEESILYVTQAFLTRGAFDIPTRQQAPVVAGLPGLGGKLYAGTGMLTSLLAAPFYVAGDAVGQALAPNARSFLTRAVVASTFNALLAALCGVVLYAWSRRIGFSARAALGVTLITAFGTMFWVYTRTVYAETLLALCWLLAAYGVRAFHATRGARWMSVAGLATGLALLAKVQGTLILPALVVYFIALEVSLSQEQHPQEAGVHTQVPGVHTQVHPYWSVALAFAAPLIACLGVLGYYNWIRFGTPFELGYGRVLTDYPLLRGIYGQLLSSGKSVFFYAPPLVLTLIAFPRFLRRFSAEASLCLILIAAVIVFHARVAYWAGDGAWGPRYLVATMPFWVVPLGGVLADWWRNRVQRALVLAVCGAGLLVNLLGMSINFDTYIQLEPRDSVRQFVPAASPLPAQVALLEARLRGWWNAALARQGVFLTRGFVDQGDELFPQFLPARAQLWIKQDGAPGAELALYALDYRVETRPKRTLALLGDGVPVAATRVAHGDAGELEYRLPLPAKPALTLEILTLDSAHKGKRSSGVEPGVHLQWLDVTRGGTRLPLYAYLAIPNAPLEDPRELWGWFFRPTYPHFDHVVWYLNVAGLPPERTAPLLSAWFVLGIVCLGSGAWLGLTSPPIRLL